jgi:hypothetical protein
LIVVAHTQEIADAMDVNCTSILRRASKEAWPKLTMKTRGGQKTYYPFESLPDEIRLKILALA